MYSLYSVSKDLCGKLQRSEIIPLVSTQHSQTVETRQIKQIPSQGRQKFELHWVKWAPAERFPSLSRFDKSRIFMLNTGWTSLFKTRTFAKPAVLSLSCPPLYVIEIYCACSEFWCKSILSPSFVPHSVLLSKNIHPNDPVNLICRIFIEKPQYGTVFEFRIIRISGVSSGEKSEILSTSWIKVFVSGINRHFRKSSFS